MSAIFVSIESSRAKLESFPPRKKSWECAEGTTSETRLLQPLPD